VYAGRTYAVTERITSTADLIIFIGGYQFDLAPIPAAILASTWVEHGGMPHGSIRGQNSGLTASKSETIGLPLAGLTGASPRAQARARRDQWRSEGMALGSYGHSRSGFHRCQDRRKTGPDRSRLPDRQSRHHAFNNSSGVSPPIHRTGWFRVVIRIP